MNCDILISAFLLCIGCVYAWGSSDRVKLEDVKTLTLYHARMTTGRRSKAVPQMQCVGGTAGCNAFVPQVVQCYNRGSDGFDVQWECKTDMDNAFRFGRIDVVCEGYDYPDDPYILKGSCGLEYTLDLTKEGLNRKPEHNYYTSNNNNHYSEQTHLKPSKFGNLMIIVAVVLIIYAIYKTCLRQHQYSPGNDDYTNPDAPRFGGGYGYPSGSPPPPGFRQDHSYDAGCGASTSGAGYQPRNNFGNFWTGAATGGLLGYMFGNRNNSGGYSSYSEPRRSSGNWGGGFSASTSSSGSTGTRTASGFGSTRRR